MFREQAFVIVLGRWKKRIQALLGHSRAPSWASRKYLSSYAGSGVIAFLLFVLVYLVITGIYLKANRAPLPWDESQYLANSEIFLRAMQGNDAFSQMYYGITKDHPVFLLSLFSRLIALRPPLIVLLPLPADFVLGSGRAALTATYVVLILSFLALLYRFVSGFADTWTAFLAVAITSTMPVVVGLSRRFLVEYGMMILATLWLYLLVRSSNFRDRRFVAPLGVILGLGMLMKVNFPVYIVGPVLWAGFSWIREGDSAKQVWAWILNCLIIFLISLVVMSSWYIQNFHLAVYGSYDLAFGRVAGLFSLGNPLQLSTVLAYWFQSINEGISFYYFAVLVLFSTLAGIRYVLGGRRRAVRGFGNDAEVPTGLVVTWFLVPLAVFSLSLHKDYRYFVPALPALGIIMAWLITSSIGSKSLRLAAICLLLVFPLFLLCYASLPLGSTYHVTLLRFDIVTSHFGYYDERPVSQSWPQAEILGKIEQDARMNHVQGNSVGIIPVAQYNNLNTYMYASVHNDIKYYMEGFFLPLSDEESSVQRERLLQMDYLVTTTGDLGPNLSYNPEITPMLMTGELPFVEVARLALPDGSDAIIYRRSQ